MPPDFAALHPGYVVGRSLDVAQRNPGFFRALSVQSPNRHLNTPLTLLPAPLITSVVFPATLLRPTFTVAWM